MTDRISGNPHETAPASGSRGLPSLAAPEPAPAPASAEAEASADDKPAPGWSPTAWKAGSRR